MINLLRFSLPEKIVSFDIETENTGANVQQDNKRIISIQLYNPNIEEIYYDNSIEKSLEHGKERIKSLLNDGYILVGYYISKFDIPLLKDFLDLEIPPQKYIDISSMDKVERIKSKSGYSLQAVCKEVDVPCNHKKLLEPIVEKLKRDPEIIERAKIEGSKIASINSWTLQYSRDRALDRICGGTAIFQLYLEFVKSNGSHNSNFYEYAMGDVISEYELFQKIK